PSGVSWWPKRSRWEDRIIPIMGFEVSPRQATIFVISALIGAGVAAALGGADLSYFVSFAVAAAAYLALDRIAGRGSAR
ncbi:MAG: hypothetical protein ACP5ID_04835, partial [Conexivisphaera sp.]